MIKALLTDPKLFNYLLIAINLMSATRWAIARKWADVCYWLCCAGITATRETFNAVSAKLNAPHRL